MSGMSSMKTTNQTGFVRRSTNGTKPLAKSHKETTS